jgi:outer membrane protein TolC
MAVSAPTLVSVLLLLILPQFCFAQAPGTAPAAPPELTLDEAYRYALRRSETVAIRREVIAETRGRYLQALGRALPQLSLGVDYTRQSIPAGSTIPSFFARRSTTATRLTLSQTLYPGASEFTAVSIAGVERQQRVEEWTRERQLLMGDVSNAYFLVLEQQETVNVLREIDRVLAQQQAAINERIRVGRSRVSERANTQVLIAQNQAAEEQVVWIHAL